MGKSDEHICCICGKKFTGWGNDPWPVVIEEDVEDGVEAICCDDCNINVVIPKRVSNLTVSRKGDAK